MGRERTYRTEWRAIWKPDNYTGKPRIEVFYPHRVPVSVTSWRARFRGDLGGFDVLMLGRGARRPVGGDAVMRAEWEAAGTSSPPARLWGATGGEAAGAYAKAFRLSPGQNVLVRQVAEPEWAELYQMTDRGLKRLQPGGVR